MMMVKLIVCLACILSQLVSAAVDVVPPATYDRLLEAVDELQKDVKTLVENSDANGRLAILP